MEVKVLGRKELVQLLEMPKVIEGVKAAYRLKAEGKTVVWPLVSHHFEEERAVMDIRSGGVFGDENLHGLKMLNNFPQNKEKGVPPFNGMLMIFDSKTGIPLGVMDAAHITCMRTGAAGAIGAQALANPDADTLFVLGAGKQAIFQIAAVLTVLPKIRKVYVADALDLENAKRFAADCPGRLLEEFNLECGAVTFAPAIDLEKAVGESQVIVTITPAREPVIKKEWVKPGTHFSCIGADMEGKEEIDPEIFAGSRVFADDIGQCVRVGEMEIPVRQGILPQASIAGEIGQVLAGMIQGRTSAEEITIFDATGLAILDLVTGKRAIEAACEKNLGITADV